MTTAPPSTSSIHEDLPIIVRDRRRKGYFTIDNELLDRYGDQLGPYGLSVYMALARFANQDSYCWPSLATIAQRTGMSRRQVIREIDTLQGVKLIAVEPQIDRKTGEHKANRYILLDLPSGDYQSPGSDSQSLLPSDPLTPGSDSPTPKQNIENKTQHRNKTQRATRSIDPTHTNNSGGQPPAPPVVGALPPVSSTSDSSEKTARKKAPKTGGAHSSVDHTPSPSSDAPPSPLREQRSTGASALIAVGITPKVAQRLAERHSLQRIEEKLQYLDFLQQEQPDKVKNPHGWLRKAIEEDYAAPDGYQSAEARAVEALEAQCYATATQQTITNQQAETVAVQERARQQGDAQLAELHRTYGTTQQEIDLWDPLLQEFKQSMPSDAFYSYVADTLLLSLKDGEALIGLPNASARDWLENRFVTKIKRSLTSCLGGQKVTVRFIDLNTAQPRSV
jgi:hypothetical protein